MRLSDHKCLMITTKPNIIRFFVSSKYQVWSKNRTLYYMVLTWNCIKMILRNSHIHADTVMLCSIIQIIIILKILSQNVCTCISLKCENCIKHDDVIKWKPFPRYWPFVRRINRSPVNSPHKGQWRGALMFSLICVWINGWVNNREAGDLRRYHAHYDVTVMEHVHDDTSWHRLSNI